MIYTLKNDFHATEARVRPDPRGYIGAQALRRAEMRLCGASDCRCGGIRGPQDVRVDRTQDGGAILTEGNV